MRSSLQWIALAAVASGCASAPVTATAPEPTPPADERPATVVLASEVEWQPLNPARGDASPRAATLWGDRNGAGPTGFLVRFVDGFASPPHIHNVSYRGVVVRGLVHNDDPNADAMWMSTGSFWTQPKGAVHITAAKGPDTVAYIEIDEGPYLVRPVDAAFSSEERPVNVHTSNVVWMDASSIGWSAQTDIAFLWGDPNGDQPSGLFVKLPEGSTAMMRGNGATFRAVVIGGRPKHVAGEVAATLGPGSHFSSDGSMQISCAAGEDCMFYVRSGGAFQVVPLQSEDENANR